MPELVRRYTVRDLESFPPDGKIKYELIRGELVVSPAPSVIHERVRLRLALELGNYLRRLGLADTLFVGPADISWDDETLVQPDLLVIRPEELTRRWNSIRHLRLAVEIVSPSSGGRDRGDKRRLYQNWRVETYWIVDPEARSVEVWRPDDWHSEVVTESLHWRVLGEAPELTIDVPGLFADLP